MAGLFGFIGEFAQAATSGALIGKAKAHYTMALQKERDSADVLGAGILKNVYGKNGVLSSMISLGRDPAAPSAYEGLGFKREDIQRLYDLMVAKRSTGSSFAPSFSFSAFELPRGTVEDLGADFAEKYESIIATRKNVEAQSAATPKRILNTSIPGGNRAS